jgi:hypothetical protein
MPAQVDWWWVEKVRSLTENEQFSANRVYEKFKREAKEGDYFPSARWIASCQAEYRDLPESVRRQYREVSWPETFEQGAIEWESAAAVLPLIQESLEKGFPRPPVRFARWFWRVTQATGPNSSVASRRKLAGLLARADLGVTDAGSTYRTAESVLLGHGAEGVEVIEGDFDQLGVTWDLMIQSDPDRWAPRQEQGNAAD